MAASFVKNIGKISYTQSGDWFCKKCRQLNYSLDEFCRACGNKGQRQPIRLGYLENQEAWQLAITRDNLPISEVIDIGCSFGSWYTRWKKLGIKIIKGIDVNPGVKSLVSKYYDEFRVGSDKDIVTHYGTENKIIAANSVVIHILENDELKDFYKNVSSALKKGGFFCVTVVNPKYYVNQVNRSRKPYRNATEHVRSLDDHKQWLIDAGLTVIDEIGTFIYPTATPEIITGLRRVPPVKTNAILHDIAKTQRDNPSNGFLLHYGPPYIIPFVDNLSPFGEVLVVTQKR